MCFADFAAGRKASRLLRGLPDASFAWGTADGRVPSLRRVILSAAKNPYLYSFPKSSEMGAKR